MGITVLKVKVVNPAARKRAATEALGLMLDPLKRELRPLPMLLVSPDQKIIAQQRA